MQKTLLLLIEGIPGSGKSTLAQFLTHTLTRSGVACRWWYEEEKGHPLYVFHDLASLQQTIDDLSAGRHQAVIEAALEKWRAFAQNLQTSEHIVILDGCLFSYLTWSLFPLDIPDGEIQRYLWEVEHILQPLHPCLIYLYQQDLAHALERICERRGSETRERLITWATESAHGKRRGLQGFDGMVRYWQDYRVLIDDAFARFNGAKLGIENSAGAWETYEQNVLDFLDLPGEENVVEDHPLSHAQYIGTYCSEEENCHVLLEDDQLLIDGVSLVWQRTRLIPHARNVFAIQSLPFQVVFEENSHGDISGMRITGPELLQGKVDRLFKQQKY